MDLLDELRRRVQDPRAATDDGAGIDDFRPLPPVSSGTIVAAERVLGFPLPKRLIDIYRTVANGGIGPGYGLLRLHDVPKVGDLVETYQYMRGSDADDMEWQWPGLLLPVFSHGCGMYECVDCGHEESPVIWHNPDYLIGRSVSSTLAPLAATLDNRLRSWIRGEDLLHAANRCLTERRKH